MSVNAMLAEQFAIAELTNPVKLGAGATRGYFDDQAIPVGDEFGPRLGEEITFYITTGSLTGLAIDVAVHIAAVGTANASDADPSYTIREAKPVQDGLVTAIVLVRTTP